jgi:hypothetical protein
MTHVANCGLYPTNVRVQPDLFQADSTSRRIPHPDSESIDPGLLYSSKAEAPPLFPSMTSTLTTKFREDLERQQHFSSNRI